MNGTSKYRTEQSDPSDPIVPNRTPVDQVSYEHTSFNLSNLKISVYILGKHIRSFIFAISF